MRVEPVRHRVVAALLVRDGRVLLCHRRPERRWYPACWDLPGGHVEEGETEVAALVRECREELGVTVVVAEPVFEVVDPTFALTVLRVVEWEGEPANVAVDEHDTVAWFGTTAIAGLPLADERYRDLFARALPGAPRVR